jgi:hypothetical protein
VTSILPLHDHEQKLSYTKLRSLVSPRPRISAAEYFDIRLLLTYDASFLSSMVTLALKRITQEHLSTCIDDLGIR